MGWFTKKTPKAADDALVEQTLAFVQEVSREQTDDDASLLAMISGIQNVADQPVRPAPAQPAATSPLLPPPAFSGDITATPTPQTMTLETPPAAPLAPPVMRTAQPMQLSDRVLAPRAAPAPKPTDLRHEIAERVQNFRAHQQRLHDEREARIQKVYAEMQAHLKRIQNQTPPV